MKKGFLEILFLCCIIITSITTAYTQSLPDSIPLRVVIIRHGEKPDKGFNLSCKGYNRSIALPKVLINLFGVPDYTYVPTILSGRTTNAVRMYQTIVPLAVKYGLVINSKFVEKDSIGIAADVLIKKGTVLIVWNSNNMPSIARSLGVSKSDLRWDKNDYDSIWIIDFVKAEGGKLQPVLTKTKENINPSSNCIF